MILDLDCFVDEFFLFDNGIVVVCVVWLIVVGDVGIFVVIVGFFVVVENFLVVGNFVDDVIEFVFVKFCVDCVSGFFDDVEIFVFVFCVVVVFVKVFVVDVNLSFVVVDMVVVDINNSYINDNRI